MKKQKKSQEHSSAKNRILVDFDGVIHKYSKRYKDGDIYDIPTEGAVQGINNLLEDGYEVVIFTARPNTKDIPKWLKRWGIPQLKITDRKIAALAYIDDRGIRFTNWRDILNYFT